MSALNGLLDRTLADLDWLVSHDTSQPKPNRPLADKLAERLERMGARIRLTSSDDGTRMNVLASFGPERAGGVVLSGHTDVVTVEGQDWSSDPFRATVIGDKVHGRGVADMKGFIACALGVLEEFRWSRFRRPVHLALSYDEELGCLGVPRLIEDLAASVPLPDLAIVGEPTSLAVVPGHKGAFVCETVFLGREAHSSRPELGCNANHAACAFAGFLAELFASARAADEAAGLPERLRTSYNLGLFNGGSALNILAGRCRMVWEFRPSARSDAEGMNAAMARYLSGKPAEHRLTAAVPPLRDADGAGVRRLAELAVLPRAEPVPYGTEAGFFERAGVPAVVFGPGSIDEAHQPDEFVPLADLEGCIAALAKIVRAQLL